MRLVGYTSILILVNLVVFILDLLSGGFLKSIFAFNTVLALERPWTFFSYMFLHSDILHILFNMLGLFFFGPLLERRIGSINFLKLYFGAGFIAAVVGYFIYPNGFLGASAAVVAVIGAVVIFFPRAQVMLYGIIPMLMWQFGILFVLIELFFATSVSNSVGNVAHLVGFAIGIGYAYYFKDKFTAKVKQVDNIKVMDVSEYQEYAKRK